MSHKPTAKDKPLADALKNSDLVHDRATVESAIVRMAGEISRDYQGRRPTVLTIMNGGLWFAARLSLELEFDAEFDYLHATRYRGNTQGSGLVWLREPSIDLRDKDVLLLDDILDEGPTLLEVRHWCQSRDVRSVKLAVMCWKRHGRAVEGLEPDYYGLEVPDRYVFGYGMDYYEQGRNLPAVYALR
ncbi:hypoxanthine-guanine phosphoribosyltransferase [Pseudomarimonas arenosa]|uniref:Hypoxanthine-guanine phosphoribosyltransferase n=1 Tax=Pseudomarimonas arenosa TaxID=2774145 RepID=A0AAW3ZIK1_9GAMM|nr:hypoxanthine-guanine phosphoribosyltransferase [Pseudomarimonas arenosa]MBD8524822.1 hypoxanthine-guanine phosphoribosyltransferase [Pseudomarimonas arenosa]